jgi:hypothetical protein
VVSWPFTWGADYDALVELDASGWSGEGAFTTMLVEQLRTFDAIEFVRVEDAPSTRADADYNFISNEVYVRFRDHKIAEPGRWLGLIPVRRLVSRPVMTLADLEAQLARMEAVGAPDYADENMLQYLRTERVIPPYQKRGYKIVELVRIYRTP